MPSGKSPKKRRTDNDTNANSIAQANSTLQVFLGQQQHRWMSGRDTLSTAQGNREPQLNAEGATQPNDVQSRAGGSSVLERSLPTTVANGTFAVLTSASVRVPDTMAQPGLPSPAASDENVAAPTMLHKPSLQVGRQIQPALKRKPSRPKKHLSPPASFQTGSPQQQSLQQQQQSLTPLTTMMKAYLLGHTQMPSPLLPDVPGRQPAIVPLQSDVPAPHSSQQAQESMLSQMAMLQRHDRFCQREAPKHQLNKIDMARLRLLKDAIDNNDLFYVVLSQIHVLANTELLPRTAQQLDQRSFLYLDSLLCSSDLLSSPVKAWLSDFPAPILQIYFSPQSAAIFEPIVRDVTDFLRFLPQRWEILIKQSRDRDCPPLVEDLCETIRLPSVVFQNTAFRAIARLLLDMTKFDDPRTGLNMLELMFQHDQKRVFRSGPRSPEEKILAYRAFRDAVKRNHQEQPAPLALHPPDEDSALQPRGGDSIPVEPSLAGRNQTASQRPAATGGNRSLSHNRHVTTHPTAPSVMQHQAAAARPQNGSAVAQQSVPSPSFVFPRHGDMPRAQPTNPDPIRSALHQAHLRSPILGPVHADKHAPRLYRHVTGFTLSPQRINNNLPIQSFTFDIPQQHFDKRAVTVPSNNADELPSRSLTENSHTYRLRCAPYPTDTGFPTESTWIVADNYWPENLYLEFNDHMLEPRRKLQHGRYLPIDLTYLAKPGENSITAIVNRASTDPGTFEYVLAVEIVGASSHDSIKTKIRTIDAKDSLQAIKASLTYGTDDDADIAVTSNTLTIKLFDPYSNSKIFDTPVRGLACRHKDCFDLETFLGVCKREMPGWPTIVDCWRCPLCRGDVRPDQLIIDGFLVEVRKGLEKQGLLNTRAIVVEADGSWRPKEEETAGVRSPSLEREERSASENPVITSASKKAVEIIEID